MYYEKFMLILLILSMMLFIKFFNHFLMMLMSLEFLVLSVLYSIYNNMYIESLDLYYLLIMVFFVIESVLGLSLLICMIHYKGSDQVKNLNLMMW